MTPKDMLALAERRALNDFIDRAGEGAVLMVSPTFYDELRRTAPWESWLHNGKDDFYRGALVEWHDEWSWGWMVRKADGSYVEGMAANTQGEDR